MTNKTRDNILSLYDEAINKTKAFRDLAKTFNVPRGELRTMLIDNGRDVPYAKKKKQEDEQKDEAKEDDPDRAAVPEVLPVPQAVLETLAKEMDALDEEIKDVTETLEHLKSKYSAIANFIKRSN